MLDKDGAATRVPVEQDLSAGDGLSAAIAASWPRLDEIGLSATALELRQLGLGGSDANIILSGERDRLIRLWREKRGEVSAEDLSGVLPVMLGCWTEEFNRQWFELQTTLSVTECGSGWTSLTHPWRRSTVDGMVEAKAAIWEAKHTGAFTKPEEVLFRYMPQLQHNMAVCGTKLAILSVIYGNHRWECYEVASDWLYQEELLEAELRFWTCVQSGDPPVPAAPPPPPKPSGYREVCFEGSNAWGAAAASWLEHAAAAKAHAASAKQIKELVEEDVSRAFGHGVEVRRSKSGALTIREVA